MGINFLLDLVPIGLIRSNHQNQPVLFILPLSQAKLFHVTEQIDSILCGFGRAISNGILCKRCNEKTPKVVVERSKYCVLCHAKGIKSCNMCEQCYESAEQKAIRVTKKATKFALKGNCVTIGCKRLPHHVLTNATMVMM